MDGIEAVKGYGSLVSSIVGVIVSLFILVRNSNIKKYEDLEKMFRGLMKDKEDDVNDCMKKVGHNVEELYNIANCNKRSIVEIKGEIKAIQKLCDERHDK